MVHHMSDKGSKTYGKFSNLDVVDTERFFLFARAQAQHGNEFSDKVEAAENQAGDDEGVEAAGEGVSKLVAELLPVVVEPASFNNSVAVEMSNVVSIRELATRPQTWIGYTHAAKKAVRILPMNPPTACTAKMSSASSQRKKYFSLVA